MRRNLSHIIAAAFNEPLLLEPAYARVFFCALGREMGAASLSVPQQQVQFDAPGMLAETDEYMAGGKRPARVYTGLSVDAVTGTEAAVFEGQSGIEAGLADELINASDAISVMATALNSNVRGGTMPQLTATEPVSASTTALFEHFMANHSPAAVRGGVSQTSADGDADVKMLMAMP